MIQDNIGANQAYSFENIWKLQNDIQPQIAIINSGFMTFLNSFNSRPGGEKEANYFIQNVFQRYFWMEYPCALILGSIQNDPNMTQKRIYGHIEKFEAQQDSSPTKVLQIWNVIQRKILQLNKGKEYISQLLEIIHSENIIPENYQDRYIIELFKNDQNNDPRVAQLQNYVQTIKSQFCAVLCYLKFKYGQALNPSNPTFDDISDIWLFLYNQQMGKNKKRDQKATPKDQSIEKKEPQKCSNRGRKPANSHEEYIEKDTHPIQDECQTIIDNTMQAETQTTRMTFKNQEQFETFEYQNHSPIHQNIFENNQDKYVQESFFSDNLSYQYNFIGQEPIEQNQNLSFLKSEKDNYYKTIDSLEREYYSNLSVQQDFSIANLLIET